MTIHGMMRESYNRVVQKGRTPQEFVLNSAAWAKYMKGRDLTERGSFLGVPIKVSANRQKTPTVAIRCKGDLHSVVA